MGTSIDLAILRVAGPCAGVCTRAELRRAGVSSTAITRRARVGLLDAVGAGVYQVPVLVGPDTPFYRAAKAHPHGVVSHASAARLWGFPALPAEHGDWIEITVPAGQGARAAIDGVLVRTTRRWIASDLSEPRPGLAATSPARTIVDLAGTGPSDGRLRHLVQTQVVAGGVTLAELGACLDRVGARGIPGAGRLRRVLADLDDGEPQPASVLERHVSRLLERGFRRQYRPPWYDGIRGVVDFAHPEARVIVEADGRRWHAVEQAMAAHRRRDRAAVANGWVVLRVTWDDVTRRPETTAAEIASVVATRRPAA